MRYHKVLAFALTSIAVAEEVLYKNSGESLEKSHATLDSASPTITAPPNGYAKRDLESLLSSIERLASKASEKGSSLLDNGETLIKNKASAISTAVDGTETLISDKLDEVNSRVLTAIKEAVTHLNEGSDSGDDSGNSAASLDAQRSVAAAVAVLGAMFIGFVAA